MQNTEEEPITLGATAAAPAAHAKCLLSPAAATLYGKILGFVLRLPPPPASSPTQAPSIHATITMYLSVSYYIAILHLSTHMAIPDDNNYATNSNMVCNHRFKKYIDLRTQEQPLFGECRGGTHYVRNDRSRTLRTQEVPFIAGCIHFTR